MTDNAWEKFAQDDPYWAVLTDPRYRTGGTGALPPKERAAFFRSGEDVIAGVADHLNMHFGRTFSSKDHCLDFGCGVGRLLLPMARRCGEAVGLDISATMRRICLQNAIEAHQANIECYGGIDHPALAGRQFDWINSYIVFQHIETTLGFRIFRELLARVKPGGVISVHFTVYKDRSVGHYLTDSFRYFSVNEDGVRSVLTKDPYYPAHDMMMNDYDVTKLYMLLGESGFDRVFTVHENQSGMHGLTFFAIKEG